MSEQTADQTKNPESQEAERLLRLMENPEVRARIAELISEASSA